MLIAGGNLFGKVGAGFQIHQQDLAEFISGEVSDQLRILVDLKSHIRQCLLGFAVILQNPQAGLFLIDDGDAGGFASRDGSGENRIILQVSGRAGRFHNTIGTGLDLIEDGHASGVGLSGVFHAGLNVFDLNDCAGKAHAGVGVLIDPQGAVRLVCKGNCGLLAVFHSNILRGIAAEQMVLRCNTLVDGIGADQIHRNCDLALGISREGADGSAFRINNLEHCASQRDFGACLQLDDLQAGLVGRLVFVSAAIIAVIGKTQRHCRVGIAHIVLQVAIFIHFRTYCVVDAVVIDIAAVRELHAAALAGDGADRIDHLEFSRIPVSGAGSGDLGDLLIVQVYDLRTCGHSGGVGKGHADVVVAHPCFRGEGEDLLHILLAIDRYGIGLRAIRLRSQSGLKNLRPCGASTIDVLGRCQDLIGTLKLHTGQRGVDLEIVDVPMAQQIAPERHLGRVIALVLILKAQLAKAPSGVAVGDDAHYLGIAADFLREVLDTLALGNRLRHTLGVRVDTIRRNLLRIAVAVNIVVVGVDQLTHSAIDGQIAQRIATVIDVHLTQSFLLGTRCESGSGEHSEHHDNCEQHTHDSFFHDFGTSML